MVEPNTDTAGLAKDVSPRTRGLFVRNLAEFQTELARIQAGFVPGLMIWEQRKKFPMLIFRTLRRVQELRLRCRELGIFLGELHLSAGVPGRAILDRLCEAKSVADFLQGGLVLVSRALVTGIDDYLKQNSGVFDLPSSPLLEGSREELVSQIAWAGEALRLLREQAELEPDPRWVEEFRELLVELPSSLLNQPVQSAAPVKISRRMGTLPLSDSVLPLGFRHLEFGPGSLPKENTYEQRAHYHAANFLQEIQAADTCASLLFDAPDMPWEFYLDVSRQMWDESRHSLFGENKLSELGCSAAQIGLSTKAYALRQTLLPADRYAALATQEADAFPGKHAGLKDAVAHRDRLSALAWSYDIADETQHVRYGNKWIPVLLEKSDDPRSFEQVKADARDWRQSVLAQVYNPAANFFSR